MSQRRQAKKDSAPRARREHSAETEQNEGKENLGKPAEAFKNQTPSKP